MTDQPQDPGPGQPQPPVPPQQPGPPQPPAQAAPQWSAPQPPSQPTPPANPYGGYAPAYAGPPPVYPGSVAYVEQHFGRVADFGQRVLASIVDALLSLVSLIPIFIAIPVVIASVPRRVGGYDQYGYPVMGETDTGLLTLGIVLMVGGFLLGFAINLWNRVFRMGRTGQSVGKSVVGLRLVDAQTGRPIGAGQCFVRELMSLLINQVVYLSYLWMLWDENKQTLADKVVHSTVIVVPKG
jgi:uncharacterized RDD family membrane protein YckC